MHESGKFFSSPSADHAKIIVSPSYTLAQKKKLLAFSFANFEMTRGSNYLGLTIKLNYTGPKKLLLNFLKFKSNKRGVSFLGECKDVITLKFWHTPQFACTENSKMEQEVKEIIREQNEKFKGSKEKWKKRAMKIPRKERETKIRREQGAWSNFEGRQQRPIICSDQGKWAPALCKQRSIPPSERWAKHSKSVLSVQIPRGKMAKKEPSLIWQINILKDTVKWH